MKTIAEISTHKAVKVGKEIQIILKGCDKKEFADNPGFVAKYPDMFNDEVLYTIPASHEDDVFAIMESYKETNKINLREFLGEL